MGKNTAWGSKAYRETRKNGGSKSEAKQASKDATDRYSAHTQVRQFGGKHGSLSDHSDFDDSVNGNGTNWHTSDDL